jgi:hypothetical protein
MSIRTTVTLDDDVAARLKEVSASRGLPFRTVLNDLVRAGLLASKSRLPQTPYKIEPLNLGVYPGVEYDNIGELLELLEGPLHR